jgi:tRNA(adenine34) deaminase
MQIDKDILFMHAALDEARSAALIGEIPVGAVITLDGQEIARAHNENRSSENPVRHAEITAIERAAAALGNERLTGCTMYVTKEPCAMCAGAIVHARIGRLVIAAEDVKYGACGTALSVCGNRTLNHVPEIEFGILREESAALLSDFFRRLREGKKDGSPAQE